MRVLLGADHVHRERGGHLGVQLDLDVVRARGFDRTGELEPTPVQRGTAGGLDRVDDLSRGDRAEQEAGVAGVREPNGRPPLPERAVSDTLRPASWSLTSLAWPRSRISRAERARLMTVTCFSAP